MGNENNNAPCPAGVGKEVFEGFKDRFDDEKERISHRLKALEAKVEEISELTTSVQKLAISVQTMAETQKEQNDRLKAIESRDGEMWRKITTQTVITVVAAIVGFVLAKIGLV